MPSRIITERSGGAREGECVQRWKWHGIAFHLYLSPGRTPLEDRLVAHVVGSPDHRIGAAPDTEPTLHFSAKHLRIDGNIPTRESVASRTPRRVAGGDGVGRASVRRTGGGKEGE